VCRLQRARARGRGGRGSYGLLRERAREGPPSPRAVGAARPAALQNMCGQAPMTLKDSGAEHARKKILRALSRHTQKSARFLVTARRVHLRLLLGRKAIAEMIGAAAIDRRRSCHTRACTVPARRIRALVPQKHPHHPHMHITPTHDPPCTAVGGHV